MKKITIEQDGCMGCGACAARFPEYIEMDENSGKAKPKKDKFDNVPDGIEEVCPAEVIHVEDA